MKKLVTYLLISVFIILNIIDIITTLKGINLVSFVEVNPIYLILGNIWVMLTIKVIVCSLAVILYFNIIKIKGSEILKYGVITSLILINLLLYSAVNSNITSIKNPELAEQVSEEIKNYAVQNNITENKVKQDIYKQNIIIPYLKSFFIIIAIFAIFRRIQKENS